MAEFLFCLLSLSIGVIHGTAHVNKAKYFIRKEYIRFQPGSPSDSLFLVLSLGRLLPL